MDKLDTNVIWFRATDIPKRDHSPFKSNPDDNKKVPLVWEPFSTQDSLLIEMKYQKIRKEESVSPLVLPVELDGLFEINLAKLEMVPVYWDGPVFEVRRGLWFQPKGVSGAYIPCEANLEVQLEEGFQKYKDKSSQKVEESKEKDPKQDTRWPLQGDYAEQYVVYFSNTVAFIQTDELASKIQRSLLMLPGTKLLRTWEEVEILKGKGTIKSSKTDPKTDLEGAKTLSPTISDIPEATENENFETMREIQHVIFVIHGIGQKLSEHIDAMSFTHDCDILRNGLKEAANNIRIQLNASNHSQKHVIPQGGGVQVLPVQWRQKLKVAVPVSSDSLTDEEAHVDLTVQDILPEGIPGIRMLVSDVILDVLLYMTPKYRQEMITHVSLEINRLYKLFTTNNPNFKGTFSIYGHSLGSVIAFDILTHQTEEKLKMKRSESAKSSSEVDISDLLASNLHKAKIEGLMEPIFDIRSEKLLFETDHLFAIGSPIGMFLLLGGYAFRTPSEATISIQKEEKVAIPATKNFFNIFHPYDPVAHRIEPLYSHKMTSLKPIPILYSKGGLTQTVKGIEAARTEMVERGKSLFTGLVSSAGSMLTKISGTQQFVVVDDSIHMESLSNNREGNLSEFKGNLGGKESLVDKKISSLNTKTSPERKGTSTGTSKPSSRIDPNGAQQSVILKLKSINTHGRLDFVLQESLLENPYLSSLGVHVYFFNVDVLLE